MGGYYNVPISFYNGESDLRCSYGVATISIDSSGNPVGLSDTYNFNEGDRSFPYESVTGAIRAIGDTGGYAIKYGYTW